MPPRTVFENEMIELREQLKKMSFQTESFYDKLFKALEIKNEEGILALLEEERQIDEMEKSVESKCLSLITKQHPVARDLRMVSASLKVVTDIKRVGIHVIDMAELLLRMQMKDLSQFSAYMPEMVKETKEMLHNAVNAFLCRNMEEAESVIEGDDVVDALFNRVKEDLVLLLQKETVNADDCIDALMIAKYLEKIGDHAVNVGEWEIFQETGNMRDVRLL